MGMDEFLLRGWVWDSETRPCPAPLPSLNKLEHTCTNQELISIRNDSELAHNFFSLSF